MKKFLSTVLILILAATTVFSFAGCKSGPAKMEEGKKEHKTGEEIEGEVVVDPQGKEFVLPKAQKAVLEKNFLDYEKYTADGNKMAENDWGDVYYIQFSGLKNQSILDKINKTIKDAFLDIYTKDPYYLPAWEGLSEKAKDYDAASFSLYVVPGGGFNNLQSVNLEYNLSLSRMNPATGFEEYCYANDSIPMTFDLSTGKVISLFDLFDETDSFTAKEYVDYIVKKHIDEYNPETDFFGCGPSEELRCVSEFVGFEKDQRFTLSELGKINLIFNYTTPQFIMDEEFMSKSIAFDVLDGVDYDKFLTSDWLFTKGEPIKFFASQTLTKKKNLEESATPKLGEGLFAVVALENYEELTEKQNAFLSIPQEEINRYAADYADKYVEISGLNGVSNVYGDFRLTSYADRFGDYVCLTRSLGAVIGYQLNGNYENENLSFEERKVFKMGSDAELSLDDMFKNRSAKAVLPSAMMQSINQNVEDSANYINYYMDESQKTLFINALCDSLAGFGINNYGLYLEFDEAQDIYKTIAANDENASSMYIYLNGAQSLEFDVFGKDELSIF